MHLHFKHLPADQVFALERRIVDDLADHGGALSDRGEDVDGTLRVGRRDGHDHAEEANPEQRRPARVATAPLQPTFELPRGPGEDRHVVEEAVDFRREIRRGCVALLRLFREALQADRLS